MKKSELLNLLQKEYHQCEAFLDQIGLARMDQPGVNGERFLTGKFFNHFHNDHEPDIRTWLARVEKQKLRPSTPPLDQSKEEPAHGDQ